MTRNRRFCGRVQITLSGEYWNDVVDSEPLFWGEVDVRASLFGPANDSGLVPLFAGRGFPAGSEGDLGPGGSLDHDAVSCASWASYEEICAIDREEVASFRDKRVHEYRLDERGALWEAATWGGTTAPASVREALSLDPTREVRLGESIYRRPLLRRGDVLDASLFPTLRRLMDCLADQFGREHVRWVIWLQDEELLVRAAS